MKIAKFGQGRLRRRDCVPWKGREEFYDAECPGIQVPMGQYHTLVCLEDGSVIFEAKDRAFDPVGTEEFFGEAGF